jgi:hypothetical protein
LICFLRTAKETFNVLTTKDFRRDGAAFKPEIASALGIERLSRPTKEGP